ncbi:MAG: hypothetical protein GXY74_13930 [Phycisphaerae bacterium]|nr:hypothetical protein [Phycisphaerae bacterium]
MTLWALRATVLAAVLSVAFPAWAGTQTYAVFCSRDDTYSSGTDNNYTLSTVGVPYSNAAARTFFRWQVHVPKQATITSAYIRMVANTAGTGTSNADIRLVDQDDCASFVYVPYDLPVTATVVNWTSGVWTPGAWVQSADVKALVREFINRPGYEYGNVLGLRISNDGGNERRCYTWDNGDHSYAPILEVNYTGGQAYLELWMAEPHIRIAQKVYCQIDNVSPTDKLVARLDGAVIHEKVGELEAEEVFTADYRQLLAGEHTLLVEIRDASDAVRGTASKTWIKVEDGIAAVGIDENNALCRNGQPFFPVTPWGLDTNYFAQWQPYINCLHGQGWNVPDNPTGWINYVASASSVGLPVIGPAQGNYWPGGRTSNIYEDPPGSGIWVHATAVDIDQLGVYVNSTKDHPAMFMWNWKDEPDLGGATEYIPATEVKRWTDKCHELDGNHPHLVNIVGYSFTHGPEPNWNQERAQSYCFLYSDRHNVTMGTNLPFDRKTCCADVMAFDYYPYEYATRYTWCSLEDSLLAVDRLRGWNYNLIPTMTWIETCDIRSAPDYPWTPAPTPTELRNMCWTNVIHGVKGIQWFHYFEPTPSENYAVMAQFKTQITELTPVVLGPEECDTEVTDVEAGGGRVDIMTREYNGQLYVFAAEIRAQTEVVRFNVDQLALGTQIAVYGEGRTLLSESGYFEDSFSPLAVHIYVVEKPGPGEVEEWTIASTHGGTTYEIAYADGYVHSPMAGVTQMKLRFSKAVAPGTVSPAAFTVVGQAGGDVSAQIVSTVVSGDYRTVTVTFASALPDADRYTMTMLDSVKDTAGNPFGGATVRQFTCLAGDVDGSGAVTAADVLAARGSAGATMSSVRVRFDVDGSGTLTASDMMAVRRLLGHTLP